MNGVIAGFLLLLTGLKPNKMYKGIFYTHLISVNIFLVIYIVKTVLLLANNEAALVRFTKGIRIIEMIVSTLFLITGIYLIVEGQGVTTLQIIKIVLVFASIPLAVVGFKKRNKVLAVLSLLMIIAAYGLAEINKKQRMEKGVENAVATANGHDIFMANCASCHGEDGKLGLSGAKDLSVSVLDLNSKMEIIKNGKSPMPGYTGILTEDQIKAVTDFTETLKN